MKSELTRIDELEVIATGYHLSIEPDDKWIEEICQEHSCAWLADLISTQDAVVELGYGDGFTLSRLHELPARYTVVEGSPSLAAEVRRRWPGVDVVQSLFETHRPASPVDKILALHVFEHVDDPVALARHLSTWLAPAGELIVMVPNRGSLHRRLGVAMGLHPDLDSLSERDLIVGHQRVYDFESLEADLRAGGLEPFARKGFFTKLLSNKQMLGFPPDVFRGLLALADDIDPALTSFVAVRCRTAA